MDKTTARPKAQPAGIVLRLAASAYDAAIFFGVAFVAFIPVAMATHFIGAIPGWVKTMLLASLAYAYFVGFWVRSGATTGMQPWRLRVAMATNGDLPGLAAATLRFFTLAATWTCLGITIFHVMTGHAAGLVFFIASAIPAISLICMGVTRQRQALHDLIAGTSVFRLQKLSETAQSSP